MKNVDNTENNTLNGKQAEIKTFSDLIKFSKANWLIFALISLFTFIIYGNIITGEFVNLDDMSRNMARPEIQNIMIPLKALDGFDIFLSVLYNIFGINSSAFHVLVIILHIINGYLVFLLTYKIFGKKPALITTFLFLSHPANTESISWHAGYLYPLRNVIILLVLIFFTLFKDSRKLRYNLASAGFLLLGMIFFRRQGWIFIAPLLLGLLDQFVFESKIKIKNIKDYIPFIIVSLSFAAVLLPGFFKQRIVDLETSYYVDIEKATPLINRIPYIIYMEYKTLVFPKELSIYREGKYISNVEYTFMIIVTVAVITGIIYLLKRQRKISGLMIMIIFSILPSFSPTVIAWTAADRYLYTPSIFFSMILSLVLLGIEERINKKRSKGKDKRESKFALYTTIVIVILYSTRTVIRNNDLRNSKNLWLATKKVAPYSYRVYNNLGDVYSNEGNYEMAIESFKRSVALKPDYADAVHNIGHVYMQMHDYQNAKKYLQQSLDMRPRLYPAAYKLGYIAYLEKDLGKAREYFEKCLSIEPSNIDCINGINLLEQ